MQSHTVAEAPPAAAGLDPDLRGALPPVVVGEKDAVKREHEWPGNLFVILSYVAAVGLAASAVGSIGWAFITGDGGKLAWGAGAAVWAVLQWRLAGEVQHFSRWGWYGAMAELTAASAAKIWTIAEGNVVGGVIGLCIDIAWMSYFWDRRAEFDVDVEL